VTDLAQGIALVDVNEVVHEVLTRGARYWRGREEQSEEGRARGKRGGEELDICFSTKPALGDKAIGCRSAWKLWCDLKMMGGGGGPGLAGTRLHQCGRIDSVQCAQLASVPDACVHGEFGHPRWVSCQISMPGCTASVGRPFINATDLSNDFKLEIRNMNLPDVQN
jgi:hypothetical protein